MQDIDGRLAIESDGKQTGVTAEAPVTPTMFKRAPTVAE